MIDSRSRDRRGLSPHCPEPPVYLEQSPPIRFADLVFMAALTADDRADELARRVRRLLVGPRPSSATQLPAVGRLVRKMRRLSRLVPWAKRRHPATYGVRNDR